MQFLTKRPMPAPRVLVAFALLLLSVSARAGTVYKTAQAAGLDTFVAAVDAAGLKKRLDNTNYKGTVFPPTDDAFDKWAQKTGMKLEALLGNKALLTTLLQYHIIDYDVLNTSKLYTLQMWDTTLAARTLALYKTSNSTLRVYFGRQRPGTKTVNFDGSANSVQVDITADKAVMHIINTVLIPNM